MQMDDLMTQITPAGAGTPAGAMAPLDAIAQADEIPLTDTDPNTFDPLDLLGTDEGLIALSNEDEQRLLYQVRDALSKAEGVMANVRQRARIDRNYYEMLEKIPAYKDGPNYTVPTTRNKTDGVFSHILETIEQTPLFSVSGYTEDDIAVAAVNQAYLEREVAFGDNRERLTSGTVKETGVVGTAFVYLEMVEGPNNEPFVQAGIAKLENMFIYPVEVNDLSQCFVARRFKQPYYILEEQAERGLLVPERVEKLRSSFAVGDSLVPNKTQPDQTQDFHFSEEMHPHELFEFYIRFRPKGEKISLFHGIYHQPTHQLLRATLNPYREAFDAPPYRNVRFMSHENYALGTSLPSVLRTPQKIFDDALNSRAAYNRIAATPPYLYNWNNKQLRKALQDGIIPGMGIPNMGPMDRRDIGAIEFPHPNLTIQDMEMARQLADEATYNDATIGGISGTTRKTKYQFQTEFNVGMLRLRLNLRDYIYDMSSVGQMIRAMQVAYKVRREGIVKVDTDSRISKLLSFTPITTEMLSQDIPQILLSMPPEELQDFDLVGFATDFERMLVNNTIPPASHQGLKVSMTGSKIISDKVYESAMYEEFASYISLLPHAAEDTRIWYYLKRVAESKGIIDWRRLIGEDPQTKLDNATFSQIVQPFNEVMQRRSTV